MRNQSMRNKRNKRNNKTTKQQTNKQNNKTTNKQTNKKSNETKCMNIKASEKKPSKNVRVSRNRQTEKRPTWENLTE